jgi:hypothetical protein
VVTGGDAIEPLEEARGAVSSALCPATSEWIPFTLRKALARTPARVGPGRTIPGGAALETLVTRYWYCMAEA